jgi:hypothetical protein
MLNLSDMNVDVGKYQRFGGIYFHCTVLLLLWTWSIVQYPNTKPRRFETGEQPAPETLWFSFRTHIDRSENLKPHLVKI